MSRFSSTFCVALATALISISASDSASADDLVASVLPLSRSPLVGQTATAFVAVINASNQPLDGSTVTLPGFCGGFAFQTTDPWTNALTRTQNQPFSLADSGLGSIQTFPVFLPPAASMPPTDELFVFGCSGASPAASIIGLDTLLLSASATHLLQMGGRS